MKPVLALIALIFGMTGCSHSQYKAEVAGPGAKADTKTKIGVIYSIPPESGQLRMKVVSLGVVKDENKKPVLKIRLYFVRKFLKAGENGSTENKALEYLDPEEQSVMVTHDKKTIHPSKIFGNPSKKPLIELTQNQRQVIELLFPLPQKLDKNEDIQHFKFFWKIHYAPFKSEEQVTRFDREDQGPQNNAAFMTDPDYPDYPIDELPMFPYPYDWVPGGWLWW